VLSILTTVPPDLPALQEQLLERPLPDMEVLDRRTMSALELIRRVVEADGKVDVLLLNGSGRVDQVAAALLWRRHSRTVVVISDCTWTIGSSLPDRLANRVGLRAIDAPRVHYCVLSTAELESFPRTWGVDHQRVAFTPFCSTLTRNDLAGSVSSDGSVFAGGDSLRDYGPLVAAAPRIRARVVLAARNLPRPAGAQPLPANIEAGPVSPARFVQLMRQAAVVVIPLKPGTERSAGQQTYLNAMALEKIVVATDSPGIRDYIDHGETGIVIPPGDDDALADAVNWALDPANTSEIDGMRLRAHEAASMRFTPLRHFDALLDVARAAARNAGIG
jgi:glycosyltransferase involved in cell wall biosynthesis